MEGNHIGRQLDAGGSGGLIAYDIPVSGARNGANTHDNGAIGCAFSPEHAGKNIVTVRRKMTEL